MNLNKHMNTYLVFDLDGTLSDTQKIHQQIESDFLMEK
jgi:beta-phosphoglucomutase-like phosphatase (HAD superfamily)